MSRRRMVVALLFTAAGITPLAALGAAWADQQAGWKAESTVTINGRTAATFSKPATPSEVPVAPLAPATQAAVPQAVVPPPATTTEPAKTPASDAKPDSKPTGKSSPTKTADPVPTETATATPPAPPANQDPTGQPPEGGK